MKNTVKNFLGIKSLLHRGNNVKCLLCGFEATKFNERRCFKCDSLPRVRLIPFCLDYFKLTNAESILHVATNIQEYNFVMKNGNYKRYDRLNIVPSKHINLVEDLTKLTLSSDQYDLIIIWHVLEHIPNDIDAMKEMYRVLKSDGKILVSVPIYPKGNPTTKESDDIDRSQFLQIHGHADHCRSCGLDYYLRFEEVGFTTQTVHSNEIDEATKNKLGLSMGHTVWMFTK